MKDVALITGASSGIGKELARLHASNGGDLVMVARREQALLELKAELETQHDVNPGQMHRDGLERPQLAEAGFRPSHS